MSRELRCDVGAIRITADLRSLQPRAHSADLQIDTCEILPCRICGHTFIVWKHGDLRERESYHIALSNTNSA